MSALLLEWARQHAAPLIAFAPLMGAAASMLIPAKAVRGLIALGVLIGCAILGVDMAAQATLSGVRAYALGAIPAPFGIVLQADGLAALSAGAIAVLALVGWIARGGEAGAPSQVESTAVLICISALQCAVLSGDLLTIFLSFQAGALSAVAAASVGHHDDRRVLPAAFLALISLGLAGALFLTGLALTRETLGGLDIQMGAGLMASKTVNSALVAGLILMVGAALCWAASAPAAAWAPVLFGRGATLSALVLAAAFATAGFAILTRLYALALTQPAHGAPFSIFVGVAGAATVIVAALRAASAQCVRRLAGYALGVQMGGAMIGLALAGDGAAAGLLHILHAGAMAIILHAAGVRFRDPARASTPIARLDGAGRRTPFLAAGVTIALLALVAAPATAPFLSKWLIVEASLERGWGWAAAALVFGSLAGVLVTGRVIERMYFRAPHADAPAKRLGHVLLSLSVAVSAAWLIVCGFEGTTPLAAAQAVMFPLFAAAGTP